jgi:integrase
MKSRYRLYRRHEGVFYVFDNLTRKRESLKTNQRAEALQLLVTKNEAHDRPALSLHKARIYLKESDPTLAMRTWQQALDALIETKHGETQTRWRRAAKEKALDFVRSRIIIETQAEHLLAVLKAGTVSTNVHLRKLHNFCLNMSWLPWPIIPKLQWPAIRFAEKRAITAVEHRKIVEKETNSERRAFYEICWHLGGAQIDVVNLRAEDIDWQQRTIAYARKKSSSPAMIHMGEEVERVLRSLPASGALFPAFSQLTSGHRATEFARACRRAEVKGVTLHSYRYAWAERAKACGYPERFAQQALGHNSAAVHRAYAKKAHMRLPSLEEYEKKLFTYRR